MEFKDRLEHAMKLRGIKQIELSARTGLAPGTISNYVQGKYKAKGENLRKLSEALNVNGAWLEGYDAPIEIQRNSRLSLGGDLEQWEIDYYSNLDAFADIEESVTRDELDLLTAYRDADKGIQKAVRKILDMEDKQ